MENKTLFVDTYLKPLIVALKIGVVDVRYKRCPHDGYIGDEYVTLIYQNGYTKEICVTADSLSALTRDVLKDL